MESLRLDLTGHFETLIRLYLIAFISNDDNHLFCVANSAFDDLELFQLFLFSIKSIQWLNCPIWVMYSGRKI